MGRLWTNERCEMGSKKTKALERPSRKLGQWKSSQNSNNW